jgi:hypothetical protein
MRLRSLGVLTDKRPFLGVCLRTERCRRPPGTQRHRRRPVVSKARQPLYRMKADFFKTLGHPARIRVLELLSERE